jgi:hypothetical protein
MGKKVKQKITFTLFVLGASTALPVNQVFLISKFNDSKNWRLK